LLCTCLATGAHAQTAEDITVTGKTPNTAQQLAPSEVPIDATEPTSIIGAQTLEKLAVPTEDYNDIVRLTPSAMDVSPVGPGLQQDFAQSIRGLQYTQFSVLYDGIQIPGLPFNFAPQPGIYFMENDISQITVQRGPSEPSSIGSETFGGFVNLSSPPVSQTSQVIPYSTIGSGGVRLFGLEGQTGALSWLNGGRILADVSDEEGRGNTSGTDTLRRNVFVKYEQPLGADTLLTFVTNVDNANTLTPYGATIPNMMLYGPTYSLNDNPDSQTYRKYNHDEYNTDFEYLRLKSTIADGLVIDNKAYTVSYFQHDFKGSDVGGTAPNLSGDVYLNGGSVPTNVTGDVPGVHAHIDFRAWGDVFKLSQDTRFGQFRAGIWFEREGFNFTDYTADLSRGTAYTLTPDSSPFFLNFKAPLTTIQPFAEFAWKALPTLTITAGLKYSEILRSIKGPEGLIGAPTDAHQSYGAALPAADAHWQPAPWIALFAQYSKGFQTPNLNLFATTNVTAVNPSTTDSYQIGTVINQKWLNLGIDLYDIEYTNFINSRSTGVVTTYFNQGGANYRGIEVEQTVKLPYGFSVYANGSLNDSSYYANGNNLAQTPRRTGALGVTYDQGGVFREGDDAHVIIIAKNVGPQYALDTSAPGQFDQIPIKSYNQVDLDVGYILPIWNRRLRVDVHVYDLFNDTSITGYDGNTVGPPSQPLFFTNPGRSIYFSLKAFL
jgi:iron complex outermembrane receptor protein